MSIDLTTITVVNETGEDLTLEFRKPEPDESVVALLTNHTTGEVREQRLFMPFGKEWRAKAEHRMESWDTDYLTPMTVVANSEEG